MKHTDEVLTALRDACLYSEDTFVDQNCNYTEILDHLIVKNALFPVGRSGNGMRYWISKQDEVDLQGIFGKEVSDIALYNASCLADAKFNSTRHNIIETVLSKVSSELPELASITAFSDGYAKLHVIFDDNITFSLQKSTECYIGDEVSFDSKADLAHVRQAYTVYLGGMAELMFIDITTESINGKGVPGELTYHIAFTESQNDKDNESKLPNSLLILLEHRDCGVKFLHVLYDVRQNILEY